MGIVAIRNGLFRTLTACGPYAAGQISACGYDVLEGGAACAITFAPGSDTGMDDLTYSQNPVAYAWNWDIEGSIWIKDTGDSKALFAKVWQAHDDFKNTIKKDGTLNGTAADALLQRMGWNPEAAFEAAGQVWARIDWKLTAVEY